MTKNETLVNDEKKQKLNFILFSWYEKNRRKMPWRNTNDPYRILISEVMLQQTQVDRVRLKYSEFLNEFPDVHALAEAPLSSILRSWSGLGYNRRARYIHECAKIVVSNYQGIFPKTYQDLVRLPGIGRSTAGALLAFSFKKDTPMIDTNIRRILIRVFFSQKKVQPSDAELYEFAEKIIPKGKGRTWNYAMLDIGALACTSKSHSENCPLKALHGRIPVPVKKVKQGKFIGSRRYYRGEMVRQLLKKNGLTLKQLARLIQTSEDECRLIAEALIQDQFVVLVGKKYLLTPH